MSLEYINNHYGTDFCVGDWIEFSPRPGTTYKGRVVGANGPHVRGEFVIDDEFVFYNLHPRWNLVNLSEKDREKYLTKLHYS